MISRNRSISTAAAMSIERTTSANNTVTCLYFAVSPETAVGAPHSSQNLAFTRRPAPHDPHATPAVIRAPPIWGPDYPDCPRIGRSPARYMETPGGSWTSTVDQSDRQIATIRRPR